MKKRCLHILLPALILLCMPDLSGQERDIPEGKVAYGIIQGEDTIPMMVIPELKIYHLHEYDYLWMKRKYRRLIYNVKRAYPYAKIAGYRLKQLDDHLATLETEKERKEYIDREEKEIMDKFEQDVKKLTITQGIILVKLIDRETGRTSYEVIKDIKGGFTAFFWQGVARLFGNNLKLQYDAEGEDRIIEDIVRGIEAGFI